MNKISAKMNKASSKMNNISGNISDVSNSVDKAVNGLNAASDFMNKFDNLYLETDLSTIQNWEVCFFFLWYTEQVLPLLSLPYDAFGSFLSAIDLGGDAAAELPARLIGLVSFLPAAIPGVGFAIGPLSDIIQTIAEILPNILVTFIKIIQLGFTLSRRQWDLFYKNVVDIIPEGEDLAMLIQTNCLFINRP